MLRRKGITAGFATCQDADSFVESTVALPFAPTDTIADAIAHERTREGAMTHLGTCFCGAVQVEVTGSPEGMGYCHCQSCRSWSGGPVNAFSLWKPEAVRV